MSKAFGEAVRLAREGRPLSQEKLGELVGVSGVQISRIESGKQAGSASTLTAIAKELGISLDLLKVADELDNPLTVPDFPTPVP